MDTQCGLPAPSLGSPISSLSPFTHTTVVSCTSFPSTAATRRCDTGVRSAIELHLGAASSGASSLVDGDRRGDGLMRRGRAVESCDLVDVGAPWVAVNNNIGELCLYSRACHQTSGEGMLQLANLGALIEDIDHKRRGCDEAGLELLFALAVRAHRGDEHAGDDVGPHHKGATGWCARDAHVAVTQRGAQVLGRLYVQVETRGGTGGHALRALVVSVKDPGALQRQDCGNGGKLELTLDAAADDRRRPRVTPGEEFRGHGRSGARAERRHAAGFDDGKRYTVACISKHDRPLDRRESKALWVLREIRVCLCREIATL